MVVGRSTINILLFRKKNTEQQTTNNRIEYTFLATLVRVKKYVSMQKHEGNNHWTSEH